VSVSEGRSTSPDARICQSGGKEKQSQNEYNKQIFGSSLSSDSDSVADDEMGEEPSPSVRFLKDPKTTASPKKVGNKRKSRKSNSSSSRNKGCKKASLLNH
jgi:hypothetical protein